MTAVLAAAGRMLLEAALVLAAMIAVLRAYAAHTAGAELAAVAWILVTALLVVAVTWVATPPEEGEGDG